MDNVRATQLRDLLISKYAAFSKSLKTLGHTNCVVPDLKFINDFPFKVLQFCIPQALQLQTKNQINKLPKAGIIKRNCSESAYPIILVKNKPDSTGKQKYRLAMDLRMLNSIIQSSSYP